MLGGCASQDITRIAIVPRSATYILRDGKYVTVVHHEPGTRFPFGFMPAHSDTTFIFTDTTRHEPISISILPEAMPDNSAWPATPPGMALSKN